MSVLQIKAGTTDVSVTLRIADSTDGTPETGVVFNTSGIDLWYRREGAASVDITEATLAALTTAHTDGGFLHINDGVYRLDLPDAACATGVAGVQIGGTVTGMVVYGPYIQLPVNTAEDVYTRVGAPAGASVSADIAAIEAQTDDIGAAGAGLTAADDAILAILGTPAGASLSADVAAVKSDTAAILVDTAEIGVAGAGLTAINLPNQTMDIVGNITGNLSGSVGSVTGNVGGNVVGSVASIAAGGIANTSFAAAAIDAAAIAPSAIGASEIAANALTDAKFDSTGKLAAHLPSILKVIVGAGSTTTAIVLNATTGIDGAAPSATNDFFNGAVFVATSGALAGQRTDVTDYVGATVTLTVTALTGAPAEGTTGILI